MDKAVQTVETVAIRFAGDSGDGMQLTGTQFSDTTALAGNDLATFPDFPAEIRAPAGSLAGVSGFQINFSSVPVHTPGDQPDVLIAMNPAALKANVGDLRTGGILIANTEQFSKKNLARAGYEGDPLEDGSLTNYRLFPADITGMTLKSIEALRLNTRTAVRCKNFFALGLVYWLYNRKMAHTETWIQSKFKDPQLAEANLRALRAGYNFGDTTEMFEQHYEVQRAAIEPGSYRSITGNEALGLGFLAAAELSGLELFLASYPITPASDILHFLAKHKGLGVRTFQAEDEIAAVSAAIGAAYVGGLALTTTSGPGLALKGEAIGLAHILELPLVIVNVQRGGPSTGLPTKTEQADLMQALYGRNGEAPVPVIAPQSAGDCFYAAIEAARIAVRHMTPVLLLSDGFVANSSEPWSVPNVANLAPIEVEFRTDPSGFKPYERDERGARPWALPGVPGLEHRIGGLEKEDLTGDVSYDPENHERMIKLRTEKVMKVVDDLPPVEVFGDESGTVVVGWGSTYGAIRAGVQQMRTRGHAVAHVHLRHLYPFKRDLGDVLRCYDRVFVPELNNGQLVKLLRATFLVDAISMPKIQGQPYKEREIVEALAGRLEAN